MSGSRELDERVHREIFGLPTEQRQWCEDWERFVFGPYSRRCPRCGTRTSANFSTKSGPCAPPVPRYSSDIAAAWLVVAEMRRQGRYHGFCWAVHQEIGYDERVPEDLGWLLLERDANEVARLICRGALRAIAEPSVLDLGGAARMNAALAAVQQQAATAGPREQGVAG